jgi:hypothetical protein
LPRALQRLFSCCEYLPVVRQILLEPAGAPPRAEGTHAQAAALAEAKAWLDGLIEAQAKQLRKKLTGG